MKIIILGATGQVGSQLVAEALSRGHVVTGVARRPDARPQDPQFSPVMADVTVEAELSRILARHDAVFSAVPFLVLGGHALISGLRRAGVRRLLAVGGAGSLEVAPGKRLVDTADFPVEYRAEALAGAGFLEALRRETELEWTFLSPSAVLHPGSRSAHFRLGLDELLVDANGISHISIPDFAMALVDELERPAYTRRRFTVGY